ARVAAGAFICCRWVSGGGGAADYLPATAWTAACTVVASYGAFGSLAGARWSAEWHRMLWAAVALMSATAIASRVSFVLLADSFQRRTSFSASPANGWLTPANTAG